VIPKTPDGTDGKKVEPQGAYEFRKPI